ncbi:hypothetical protein GIB67_008719 [Kingdonia uniflora]|uniref:DUF4378 domain-containing protein n=1 Tax=Kingdonia uniflora TaxID=39325 RepID=A0A7J7NGC3_9MAGN|nr:hypothetical protein GIB67_008719 [Kingdonia uniflora]
MVLISASEMGVEKQGSKGGGRYVGGFLQLFDWNGKSRKKLFSSNSDFQEESKQGKRNDNNYPMTRLHIDEDDNGVSSIRGSSDYSCASSVTDDEGNRIKAPGVVARLMGLDSLPTSSGIPEPHCTPFSDFRSLQDSHYRRTPDFLYKHQIGVPADLDGFPRYPLESKFQRLRSNPIERFQTEILPPKSAKSISSTHHKLLSPIKRPGFIPTKNAAQIMEEAAKIIEPGPQITSRKLPPISSSSAPLRVRDLKEKMEAAQRSSKLPQTSRRPVESNAVKYLKEQSLNKSWDGAENTPQFRDSYSSKESNSIGSNNKGKSISLAVQAKVNVQRRSVSSSSIGTNFSAPKDHNEFKSDIQKSLLKKPSSHNSSGVLKQNNQKQNSLTKKEKLPLKPSVPSQQSRKTLSVDSSSGRNRNSSKVSGSSRVGSRRSSLETTNSGTVTKNCPRKKRSVGGGFHIDRSGFDDNILSSKDEKSLQPSVAKDGHEKLAEDNGRKSMDVVSFTFTSPMKKSVREAQSSIHIVEKHNNLYVDSSIEKNPADAKKARINCTGLNMIGGDALSILLEQKLMELTYGVESSSCNSIKSRTVVSSSALLHDLVSDHGAITTTPEECDSGFQLLLHTDKFSNRYGSNGFSSDVHKWQGVEDCGSSNKSGPSKELDYRNPSPISILEPLFSNESCNSSDSGDSNSSNGGKYHSSFQSEQVVDSICSSKLRMNGRADLSHSNSSTSTSNWELDYIREILCNADSMFKDYTLGRAQEIINPHLFDQLENRKPRSRINDFEAENNLRLTRKALFDGVCECLDLRFIRFVGGGWKQWAKGVGIFRRKEWLVEEVYREITGWRSMGEWMLDELVDKDMSTQYGRWLDFEIDEFEVGKEIEKDVLNSLVDEVFSDFLFL